MKNLTKIKVVGVGGSGSNAVSRMKKCKIKGVELIAINTDAQDLAKGKADFKLRIGKKTTQGLGAGANPEIGRKSALENRQDISEILKDADMIFITCGEGGGTGTGGTPAQTTGRHLRNVHPQRLCLRSHSAGRADLCDPWCP